MNDIVSIRKMRPGAPPFSSAHAAFPEEDAGGTGPFLPEDGVTDRVADDFARGDNDSQFSSLDLPRIPSRKRPARTWLLVLGNGCRTPDALSPADRAPAEATHSATAERIYFGLPYSVLKCN